MPDENAAPDLSYLTTLVGGAGSSGLAASDAGHPVGAPLAAAAGAGGGAAGAGYDVDLENAPQAVANLYAAADELEDMVFDAERLGQIRPPGNDMVSKVATEVFRDAAIGPTGLQAALMATAQEFRRHADKLKADLAAYRQVEEANIVLPPAQPLDFWRKA